MRTRAKGVAPSRFGWYDIVGNLVIAFVVEIFDECPYLVFEIVGEVIVFQQIAILKGSGAIVRFCL